MKSSPFQIIVIAIFSVAIVGGLIALYFTKAKNNQADVVKITLWGSAPSSYVNTVLGGLGIDPNSNKKESVGLEVTYKEISESTFNNKLIEALASGQGPDAIILPQDKIVRYQDKIYPISYASLPERTFKDTYVSEAELYLSPWGVLAVPFSIDPLITYWNRDMFANAGISQPPKVWDEFLNLAETLTEKDGAVTIKKSAVSLGEFSNINNAKEIISAMAFQSGSTFVTRTSDGKLVNNGDKGGNIKSVIDFYTEFANQVKPIYTWSRSLPSSIDVFARGDLGVYFGFVSEIPIIKTKNPNLDFDFTYFPQPRDATNKVTFGKMLGIATLKRSANLASAMQFAMLLGSQNGVKFWSQVTNLPPIRRDLLAIKPTDSLGSISYNSALLSRGWLEPDSDKIKTIFRDMIEAITSGWLKSGEAIGRMNSQISLIISGQ